MGEMEEKLNNILSDPQAMQRIMSLARSLGPTPEPKADPVEPSPDPLPQIDVSMLQKLSGLAQQGSIDKDQRSLLRALGPYLSRQRIEKLEKAMRAAKIARMASGFIGPSGLRL